MIGTKNLRIWLTMCSFLPALVSAATGATLYVNTDGSGGAYTSIQAAINAAKPGDQIEVAAGVYKEAIVFGGKAIRLYSKGGPAVTTIDAAGLDTSVVTCRNGEGSETILEGFTITGGTGTASGVGKVGGGMCNLSASPTVANCNFRGNRAKAGAGMANETGSPTVTNCTFSGNTADAAGGGMFNGTANVRVTNCLFSGNSAPYGGGMWNYTASPTLTNCTISSNSGSRPGMYNEQSSNPTVINSILWGNGSGAQIVNSNSTVTVTYSDVQNGYEGTGNIGADPMFMDALSGDHRLLSGSPCIDAGTNNSVPPDLTTDRDGNPRIVNQTVDIGAYEYNPALALDWVEGFVVAFPQVAKGSSGGAHVETTVVISNPWADSTHVQLWVSDGLDLPGPASLQLSPGETRQIDFKGDPFQAGWLQLIATRAVAAAAYISVKPGETESSVLSRLAILGQALSSKVALPVFHKSDFADRTAIALSCPREIVNHTVRFNLLDQTGATVATKESSSLPSRLALYLDEFFELSDSFRGGSLVVEMANPQAAMAFSLIGLYEKNGAVTVGGAQSIDTPGEYVARLKTPDQTQAAQVAEQYGVTVIKTTQSELWGLMTREVARAVARDTRIAGVFPMAYGAP